jgi:hypothetical protein
MVAVVLTLVVLGALMTWALRGELTRAATVEKTVEDDERPDGPATLAYAVPDGQDPTVLSVALSRAGFGTVSVRRGAVERLYIGCPRRTDREQVRSVIEHVRRTRLGGAEIVVTHVRFDDEIAW